MQVTTPTMVEAPLRPVVDSVKEAQVYAQEILDRLGIEGMATLDSKFPLVEEKPGWTRRWCNDLGDNIPRRLAQGWRLVGRTLEDRKNTDLGNAMSITSNVGEGPMRVVLMEIPTEIAEKILDITSLSKQRATEEAIVGGALGNTEGRYIPGDEPNSAFFGTRNRIRRAPLSAS